MKNYDGWTIKTKRELMAESFHQRRTEVVSWWNNVTAPYGDTEYWKWKNFSRRKGHKIVKVRLMEVSK